MDIISHGLWGGVSFGRSNKKFFIWSFIFGIAPDLITFGPFFVLHFSKFYRQHTNNAQTALDIPAYIFTSYNFTHSLVVAFIVITIIFLLKKKIVKFLLAWPLHILMDMPTHSINFFPTPFAWPLSDIKINGIPWSHPAIFIPNWIALTIAISWLYFHSSKRKTS